jgi:hypothetical protein
MLFLSTKFCVVYFLSDKDLPEHTFFIYFKTVGEAGTRDEPITQFV